MQQFTSVCRQAWLSLVISYFNRDLALRLCSVWRSFQLAFGKFLEARLAIVMTSQVYVRDPGRRS